MSQLFLRFLLLSTFIIAYGSVAVASDYKAQAKALINSKTSSTVYSPASKALHEAGGWIQRHYTPLEIVIFGGPDIALCALQSGFAGSAKHIGKETIVRSFEYIVRHPAAVSKQIARNTFEIGLRAYRANYMIYHNYKRTSQLTEGEAIVFISNSYMIELMEISRQFMNEITQYERGEGKYLGQDEQKIRKIDLQIERIVNAHGNKLPDQILLWKKLLEILKESRLGLPAYPPYINFKAKTKIVIDNINKSLDKNFAVKSRIIEISMKGRLKWGGPDHQEIKYIAKKYLPALDKSIALKIIESIESCQKCSKQVPIILRIELSRKINDPGICKGISYQRPKSKCYKYLAEKNNDYKICLLINNDGDRDNCLLYFIGKHIKNKDFRVCNELTNATFRDICNSEKKHYDLSQ